MVGEPESTIRGWIERGLAYPDIEPWGSFAVQYRRAERGIEAAAAGTAAMRVQLISERHQAYFDWQQNRGPEPEKPREPRKPGKKATAEERARYHEDYAMWEVADARYDRLMLAWSTPPPLPDVAELAWMDRHIEGRFPEDKGATAHRKPEPEYDAQHWLDSNAMDREQLAALFGAEDVPEPLRLALQDSAQNVYRILVAGGFDPARKAEDGEDARGAGEGSGE